MSSFTSDLVRNCPRCACPVSAEALECVQCHALIRGDEMEQLAAHARALEAQGDLQGACERWLGCLSLLPQQSAHAAWIRDHARELQTHIRSGGAVRAAKTGHWAERLGPIGPIVLALWKFKSLLSFVAFFGFYWQLWGAAFGIGFAMLVLIHEMGHFIDIKRRGLPADMPMFLPGLGAYVRWNALGVSLESRAAISLAGPLAGCLAAAVCAVLWSQTGYGLWAALARTSAWFNALNLIPLWIFDGSKAVLPLSKVERVSVLVISGALGYLLGEWVLGLVAIGTAVRLFTHDVPEEQSGTITAYFLAVLGGLALVLWLVPGHGTGMP